MPETPDFDAIARRLSSTAGAFVSSPRSIPEQEIAEQLRLMWNARGAADIADLDHAFSAGVSPSMKVIDQILRALDR